MGLRIRPGGASWAYNGFHRFRERLAEAEGLVLSEMAGFGGTRSWMNNSGYTTTLAPLLNHSDCDGYLSSYECEDMLPRLRLIVSGWPTHDYDRQQAELLIAGMEHSVEHGCGVVFT